MFVLVLLAIVMTGDPNDPVYPITRGEVAYYISQEACEADIKRQGLAFVDGLHERHAEIALFASKCVKVKGPVGEPA